MDNNPNGLDAGPNRRISPQGKQGKFEIHSLYNYFNISEPKSEKNITNKCKCPACVDSGFTYGNNSVLIEDTNPLIFTFFGRDQTK